MAWVNRNGKHYYYRSRKVAGRTFRDYVGTGLRAQEAAAEDARRRADRDASRAERRTRQAAWKAALHPLSALLPTSDLLLRAALSAAGCHRHAKGAWRRRKNVCTSP